MKELKAALEQIINHYYEGTLFEYLKEHGAVDTGICYLIAQAYGRSSAVFTQFNKYTRSIPNIDPYYPVTGGKAAYNNACKKYVENVTELGPITQLHQSPFWCGWYGAERIQFIEDAIKHINEQQPA